MTVPEGAASAVTRAQPVVSWVAGLAVVAAATALAGVLSGWVWLGTVIVTVGLVVLTGTVLRAIGLPPGLVAGGQLLALSCLLTARFTSDGLFGFFPTPEAATALGRLIAEGTKQIESNVSPVPTTTELLVLVALAVGVIAIAVDVLAVPGRAPAAVGLVLLCVVAIPVALADDGLPVWTLACGGVGFALLLASNRSRWGRPGWVAATAAALALALAVGTLATGVGTGGRTAPGAPGAGGLGLNPFTSLRGALSNPGSFELFQVRGMAEPGYLRAVTLAEYVPQRGWQIGDTGDSVPLSDQLPATGAPDAQQVELGITNVAYRDNWLPLYGVPLGVAGLDGKNWKYDPLTGVARSEAPRQEASWRQRAVIPGASAEVLRQAPERAATDRGRLDNRYSDTGGIDDRVTELAREVTRDADNDFDRAVALNEYFLDPANGFRYSLQTAPGNTGDALVDFLTRGRAGYCEQFASAMAVMLRAVGVPSRVAVGFTAGLDKGQYRSVRSSDAHAWVEAYFPGHGWLTFDPTPLADGRGVVPPYVAEATGREAGAVPAETPAQEPPPTPSPPPPAAAEDPGAAAEPPPAEPAVPAGVVWAVLATLAAAGLVAAPATLRSLARRRRLATAAAGGPAAASAGWQEVIAESVDRKVDLSPADTVRTAADRMINRHDLDPTAAEAMWQLVAAVEEGWYAERAPDGERLVAAVHEVTAGLRRCAPLGPLGRLLPRSLLRGASIRRLATNWTARVRIRERDHERDHEREHQREEEPAGLGR